MEKIKLKNKSILFNNVIIGLALLVSLLTINIQQELYIDYITSILVVYLLVKKGRPLYSASGVILSMTFLQYLTPYSLMWLILNDPTTALTQEEILSSREVVFIFNIFTLSFLFGNMLISKKDEVKTNYRIKKLDDERLFHVGIISLVSYSLIALKLGFFYHSESGEFDVQNATNYGFVMYFLYIAISIFIVLYINYRLFGSKSNYIVIYALIFFCIFLPSGMRRMLLTPILFIGLFELSQLNFAIDRKLIRIILVVVSGLALLPLLQLIRTHDKIGQYNEIELFQLIFSLLIRRLSDYIGVTYIQQHIADGTLSYIGFSDLYEGIAYLIPTVIRPEISLPYTYDAILSYNIGFRSDKTGSSPIMLIGELLLRGGLFALVPISILIGVVIAIFDKSFNIYRKNQFYLIVFGLLYYELASMHAFNLVKLFTIFTRHLFVLSILGIIILKYTRRN